MKSEDVQLESFVYISTTGDTAVVKGLPTPAGMVAVTVLDETHDAEQSHHVDNLFVLTAEEAFAERLAGAWIKYTDSLKRIWDTMSDEELTAYLGEDLGKEILPLDSSVSSENMLYKRISKSQAQWELVLRGIFRVAEEATKQPGASGMFCVYHKCDSKDCPPGIHEWNP